MTTLKSSEGGMFKNKNPTWESNKIEIRHDKNLESMPRTSSKKKEGKIEEKRKKGKRKRKKIYHVGWYLW